MAIAKMPLLSEKVCGKIGQNLVFRRVNGQTIISLSPSFKSKIRTQRQIQVSNILSELSRLHTKLTLNQLEDWKSMESYKKTTNFGILTPKSVINSFVQLNFFRRDRGMSALMVPPVNSMKGNISELTVISKPQETGSVVLGWDLPAGATQQDAVNVWVTNLFNTITRRPRQSDFHHFTYVPGNSTSFEITGLEQGKYYHFLARFVEEDGRTGAFHQSPPVLIK